MAFHHTEHHAIQRSGWLRASVLGANDGIISVTSLIMGMAASGASSHTLFITCMCRAHFRRNLNGCRRIYFG